jgi:hypothetical protein
MVALVAAVLVVGGLGGCSVLNPRDPLDDLGNLNKRLEQAGTAVVTFTGTFDPLLNPVETGWSGTSTVRFGAKPSWQTTFDKVDSFGRPSLQAQGLHVDGKTYLRSPAMIPDDRRPWFDADKTGANWQSRYADPDLRIVDLVPWLNFLNGIKEGEAMNAQTDDLKDVEGAPNEYKVKCYRTQAACPPPFGMELDTFFNVTPRNPTLSAWLDDDGLLRKFEIAGSLGYDPSRPGADGPLVKHETDEYYYAATFTLDKFGTPLNVIAPPADQVTEKLGVFYKKN